MLFVYVVFLIEVEILALDRLAAGGSPRRAHDGAFGDLFGCALLAATRIALDCHPTTASTAREATRGKPDGEVHVRRRAGDPAPRLNQNLARGDWHTSDGLLGDDVRFGSKADIRLAVELFDGLATSSLVEHSFLCAIEAEPRKPQLPRRTVNPFASFPAGVFASAPFGDIGNPQRWKDSSFTI